ncbi:FecR domain-containing protein [Bradyrhizobium sp. Arg237L]|uniref:FecR family protein n=1 Tax=Bradyrhizobium sp. Arg237L TaxID=3003352 RepID=UPI00249F85EB|nr:FecR domain-containing protein [Bradyrhizobium sp. Arg237L]MDI4236713.1 FecR domain-containing protein [Bradyrhizobium sp. Arg237L]
MSDDPNGQADVLKRDARRWVRQLVSGEATTADAEALKRWRQQSPAHDSAFTEALRVWRSLGEGGRVFIEAHGRPVWPEHRASMSRRALFAGGSALAASVAAYAVMKPPLNLWPSLDELRADYRTATGEQLRVTVADVDVQLNTQTSIAITADADDGRGVRLISGEASFAMPAQSSRALIVLAGNGQTVARQARFDVRSIAAVTCVTCIEGAVEVTAGGRSEPVQAGQRVLYDNTGLRPVAAVDRHEATSWHDGFIVFRATPLADAVAEINRYRPGRVMVLNTTLGQKTVSGRFRIERTNEILGWIERATGATSRVLPGGIILLS